MPSRAHDLLESNARGFLEDRGFTVEQERSIVCNDENITQSSFIIDVYGERNGEIIMYEVGHCTKRKLAWLRKHVGKTVHMPYITHWCFHPPTEQELDERTLYNQQRWNAMLSKMGIEAKDLPGGVDLDV